MKRNAKTAWNRRYTEGSHRSLDPDPFLVSAYSEYIAGSEPGKALDVAGGIGRHSVWLAERGWQVRLVDISEAGIDLAKNNIATRLKWSDRLFSLLETGVQDLERDRNLGKRQYDLILVFFYLQRSLFPALISALKPGGLLIYKTYTLEQRRFGGGPSHPMHLLKPNELLRACASLRTMYYRETVHDRGVAELVAQRKPAPSTGYRK